LWYYKYNTYTELYHHGVLGMRWGVRKDPENVGRDNKTYTIPEKKSAHRVRLEAKYLRKGFSDNDAEQMAAKRIMGEKFVLGMAGVAATTIAGYVAYREIGKRFSGVTLEAGKDLHYINALGDKATYDRRLYTSFEKGDTKKYKGLLAQALRKNAKDTTIYDTVLKTTEKIKAPSQHEARKLYSEFSMKKVSSSAYNEFNKNLVSDWGSKRTQMYVSFLKKKGYNAILDANDQFISGYSTKKPLILFNAASSTVKAGESIVSEQLSKRLYNRQMSKVYAKQFAPAVGVGVAAVGGLASGTTAMKYHQVNSYFKKHPNSNLSPGAVYNAVTMDPITGLYKINNSKLKGA